jgi:ApaG protein
VDIGAPGIHLTGRAQATCDILNRRGCDEVSQTTSGGGAAYAATTRNITVSVQPYYLEDQSSPDAGHYVWAYHVRIQNDGQETVQLLTRYWKITDAFGMLHEVRGDGVVGKQPVLRPGEAFEYASGTPLGTPSGIMLGTYQMQAASGERFDIVIPAFSLDSPHNRLAAN